VSRIAIIGAGAFGTALACVEAREGRQVTLYARSAAEAGTLAATRRNPKLPGAALPDNITPTADPRALARADIVLAVVPAQATRAALTALAPHLPPGAPLVMCAKGIENATLRLQTEIAAEIAPRALIAALSGPGFATEIAVGLPTAMTLAAPGDAADLQAQLSTRSLRLYLSHDVAGVQLCGALKNVVAIACGVAEGRGLGESARAALMTRGMAEMSRLARALGAKTETMMGLAGLGDLALTCGGPKSRNFRLGLALGRGAPPDAALAEGAATAAAALQAARDAGADTPIIEAVAAIIDRLITVDEAIGALLDRPLKRE
jgi:glycerol-3-phosphate dehydrogenase (NAD(P)+)